MKIARAAERMLPLLLFFTTLSAAYFWWRTEVRYQSALERIDALQKERRPAIPPATSTEPPEPAKPETKIVRVPTAIESPSALKTIDELRSAVTQLTADLAHAREESSNAAARAASAAGEYKAVAAQLAEAREALDAANRLVATAAAEAKVRNERLTRAEAAERALTEKLRVSPPKPPPAVRADADIERRREALLTSILRRYREVTDLYRGFALSMQSRDRSTAALEAGDLSRIQSSIQQAEDELRQLQALNARAAVQR